MQKTLRLILGDQLNQQHSWFNDVSESITYVFMEVRQETDYVAHHIQKVIAFFSAMRSFASVLEEKGYHVLYLKLDDEHNQQSISANIKKLIKEKNYTFFQYQLPDEYRLDQQLNILCAELNMSDVDTKAFDTEHFLTDRFYIRRFFEGKKMYLMESFYRQMRKEHNILMEPCGKKPFSGKWNYDKENRKKYKGEIPVPIPKTYVENVENLVEMCKTANLKTIGKIDAQKFIWPVSRKNALDLLEFFMEYCLPWFGTYQDAMTDQHWSLFHSRLSFALNVKLLNPLEVVNRAIEAWQEREQAISLAQVEGFIRQIIGWREYMRGIYWDKMPEFADLNFFEHKNKLPVWYWTGNTKMKCLQHSIQQSLEYAYAHHIQRLMVTGSFALLNQTHPDEVDNWYLGIYIDAIEWVEITNTRGMSQFADGGIVGTKPYIGSANYMHKMSDYCSNCYYDRKLKYGEKACPFNSLYWHFYETHRNKLAKNPRIGMMYRILDKMEIIEKKKILDQAEKYLKKVDDL